MTGALAEAARGRTTSEQGEDIVAVVLRLDGGCYVWRAPSSEHDPDVIAWAERALADARRDYASLTHRDLLTLRASRIN